MRKIIDTCLLRAISFIERLFVSSAPSLQICTPLPYAIGNFCEEVKFAFLAASITKKDVAFLFPPKSRWIQKALKYSFCNDKIVHVCEEISQRSSGRLNYALRSLAYKCCFVIIRTTYFGLIRICPAIVLDPEVARKSGLGYYMSFLRIGIAEIWKVLGQHGLQDVDMHKLDVEIGLFRSLCKELGAIDIYTMIEIGEGLERVLSSGPIVVHARSSCYYNDGNRRNRNSDIGLILRSVMKIAKALGREIVVIGDTNNLDGPEYIAVANLPRIFPSEAIRRTFETQAIAKCSLYVGTQSGPWDLAMLLGKATIILNAIDLSTCLTGCWSSQLVISKPIISKQPQKWLREYALDLNTEIAGNEYLAELTHAHLQSIANAYIAKIQQLGGNPPGDTLPSEYYAMKSKNGMQKVECDSQYFLELLAKDIDKLSERLMNTWNLMASKSKLASTKSYYLEEIARLKAKYRFAITLESQCYITIDFSN